jgi:protein-tyrosine-phosphatase
VAGRDDYRVGSAGMAASSGDRANRHAVTALDKRGARLPDFRSRPVTAELLAEATHVFAMTSGHLAALESRFPEFSDKYFLTCEFVDLPGLGVGADVPDPIGMGRAAYEEVAQILELAIPAIIRYLDETHKG